MVLMPVTLKVRTSIASISRRGGEEEEIIFLRWKVTHLTGSQIRAILAQSAAARGLATTFLKKFKVFHAYPGRVVRRSRMTVTGRGGTDTDTDMGKVLLVSVSEGVRLTTSPPQVSTFPTGNYYFLIFSFDLVQLLTFEATVTNKTMKLTTWLKSEF